MKPALLVIDMQKAFSDDPEFKTSMDSASEYINAASEWCQEKAIPIYWVHHTDEKNGPLDGQEAFEFTDKLYKKDNEIRIVKRYGNSFNKTNLYDNLKKRAIDTIFVTGFCAEYCVLSTYRGARDLDLTPILIRGALASNNSEHIKFVEEISEIISIHSLKKFLENC